MSLVMTLGVVLAVFCFDAAVAQEGYLGHDHDKWHRGFYQTLERPDTKSPCCNLTDCRPTSGKQVDGHYEVKVNGAWVSVPPGKILKQSAPDLGPGWVPRFAGSERRLNVQTGAAKRKFSNERKLKA